MAKSTRHTKARQSSDTGQPLVSLVGNVDELLDELMHRRREREGVVSMSDISVAVFTPEKDYPSLLRNGASGVRSLRSLLVLMGWDRLLPSPEAQSLAVCRKELVAILGKIGTLAQDERDLDRAAAHVLAAARDLLPADRRAQSDVVKIRSELPKDAAALVSGLKAALAVLPPPTPALAPELPPEEQEYLDALKKAAKAATIEPLEIPAKVAGGSKQNTAASTLNKKLRPFGLEIVGAKVARKQGQKVHAKKGYVLRRCTPKPQEHGA